MRSLSLWLLIGLAMVVYASPLAARSWLPFAGIGYDPATHDDGPVGRVGFATPLKMSWVHGIPFEVTGAVSGIYAPHHTVTTDSRGWDFDPHGWISTSEVLCVVARSSRRLEFSGPEAALGIGLHQLWQLRATGYREERICLSPLQHQVRLHAVLRAPLGFAESPAGPVIEAEGQAKLGHWQRDWAPDYSLQLRLGFRFHA